MRCHIFVDAENINPILFETSYADLKTKYIISRIDIFSKKDTLPKIYNKYNFNFVECFYGKNSADTFMVAYITKAVYEEALTDIFIIMTQDNDLSIAIKVITDNNKQAILITQVGKGLNYLTEIGIDKRYYTHLEYNISNNTYYKASIAKNSISKLSNYDKNRTIFIKDRKDNITEVFFNNYMPYNIFLNSISSSVMGRIRKNYSNSTKLLKILYDNYLIVKDNRIYIDIDRIDKDDK